jgi:LmbE family N-acetylglucosaminyl deacetylase
MEEPSSNDLWRAAIIVAHPDDETLWAGGFIRSHPDFDWFVASLCRASDRDRAPKFFQVLEILGAAGAMGDMDDGPQQERLPIVSIQEEILRLLPRHPFDLVLTHGPRGEYTRHRRHEEVSSAVIGLWIEGRLDAKQMGLFAYQDEGGTRLPEAIQTADLVQPLPARLFQEKRSLITEIYGFDQTSWETRTTPRSEAFWFFTSPHELRAWLEDD